MEEKNNEKITNPQIIYTWSAPLRAYKKRTNGVMRFYLALSLLLSVIVFFFGEKVLVLPIWAIMFLFYVLTVTPPHEIEHRITQFGVETVGNTFRWEILSHFYFIKKFDYEILILVAIAPFSNHLYLVIKEEKTKEDLIRILSKHLIYQEYPRKTFTDKIGDWLTQLMPQSFEPKKNKASV